VGDFCFSGTGLALAVLIHCRCLEKVGVGAFQGCLRLEELALPAHVRELGDDAFSACPKLRILEPGAPQRFVSYSLERKAGQAQVQGEREKEKEREREKEKEGEKEWLFSRVVMRIGESRSVPQPILAAAGRTFVALSGATLLTGTATRPLSPEW
jgi:hypothetical protein